LVVPSASLYGVQMRSSDARFTSFSVYSAASHVARSSTVDRSEPAA
jgi:hypothetical protein